MKDYVVTRVKYDDGWRYAVVESQMAVDWPSVQQTRDTDVPPPDRELPLDFKQVDGVDTEEEAYEKYDIWSEQ